LQGENIIVKNVRIPFLTGYTKVAIIVQNANAKRNKGIESLLIVIIPVAAALLEA
jgi:hypothetical protein